MDAREFLRGNGLAEIIKVVVEENKFETLEDLKLLAENHSFLSAIKIPVCYQVRFSAAIKKLLLQHVENGVDEMCKETNKEHDDATQNNTSPIKCSTPNTNEKRGSTTRDRNNNRPDTSLGTGSSESTSGIVSHVKMSTVVSCNKNGEISKKKLLELAKTDMTAQAVNLRYNELNKFLLAEVKRAEQRWKGAGALKKCESTSEEDAKLNNLTADEIVDNPNLNKWFGEYSIGEHGVFTINRTKAKVLVGRKLSQTRKPSAYKRKILVEVQNSDKDSDDVRGKKRTKKTMGGNMTESAKETVMTGGDEDGSESAKETVGTGGDENGSEGTGMEDGHTAGAGTKDSLDHTHTEGEATNAAHNDLSPYEMLKNKRVEENNLVLLNQNIIPSSYASITALFFLSATKLKDVTILMIKRELTKLGVTIPRGQGHTKEQLLVLLGKELFNKRKVKRIDETKVISKNNLVVVRE